MPAADCKLLCGFLQVMWIVIESQARIVSLTEDSVKNGGPFKQSKSGKATAANLKDSLRRFLGK